MSSVLEGVGWIQRVIVSEATGRILDGHLRVELAKEQGQLVPVVWVRLSEEEERIALATFDFITSQAERSKEDFEALMKEIEQGSVSLLQTLKPALDAILEEFRIAREPGGGSAPKTGSPERVSLGDVWLIEGGHRLLCGDSTDGSSVLSLFVAGEEPLIMITDPPYGVNYYPEWRNEAGRQGLAKFGTGTKAGIQGGPGDNGVFKGDDRIDWSEAYKYFSGSVIYIWHSILQAKILIESLDSLGFDIRNQIIWAKNSFAISRGHYNWQHEACFYAVRRGSSASWCGDSSQTTLWEIPIEKLDSNHSTNKPLETAARAIRNHGAPGSLVYDPFLGTGTTLIAAHRERRRCYGIEIEPKYCDDILSRCEAEGLGVEKL